MSATGGEYRVGGCSVDARSTVAARWRDNYCHRSRLFLVLLFWLPAIPRKERAPVGAVAVLRGLASADLWYTPLAMGSHSERPVVFSLYAYVGALGEGTGYGRLPDERGGGERTRPCNKRLG